MSKTGIPDGVELTEWQKKAFRDVDLETFTVEAVVPEEIEEIVEERIEANRELDREVSREDLVLEHLDLEVVWPDDE